MKKIVASLVLGVLVVFGVAAQVQFVERLEIEVKPYKDNYTVFPYKNGVLGFRIEGERGNFKQKFEYFLANRRLEQKGVKFFDVPDFFNLTGYDLEGESLYALFSKAGYSKEKMIFVLNLENGQVEHYEVNNVLPFDILEFFILDRNAVFMGHLEGRPVVQVFDMVEDNVLTLQGIYSNDAQIIQMRKDERFKAFDVVVSRKDRYKNKLISVMTFDTQGQKLREVKIDRLDDPKTEILEAVLTQVDDYNQAMFGPFGQKKKENYQGIFFASINEFGEYDNRYYTMENFSNFYNYLPERTRNRKNKSLERAIEKEKAVNIPNVITTREVINLGDSYLLYNDYFSPSNSRYITTRNNFYPGSAAYLNHHQRTFPAMGPGFTSGSFYNRPENFQFKYLAAQFMLIDNTGKLIWDNSLSLGNTILSEDMKFGQVSFDGRDLFYMYVDKTNLKLSHLRDGEILIENEEFPIELLDENHSINSTEEGSLSLMWWYDDYYLLSGKQRVKYAKKTGRDEAKNVFFVTKIKIDGSLQQYVQH
jgi:hypothetical protein